MTEQRESLLTRLGFRVGLKGPHAVRTMMLGDLRVLLTHTTPGATRADHAAAIGAENVLGKSTRSAHAFVQTKDNVERKLTLTCDDSRTSDQPNGRGGGAACCQSQIRPRGLVNESRT